ncbi:MAG: aminoacyl-tRNA hydrolase [Planctomycetes bacterium]|nr:aminoacyl-tRNA hydrolase [Planctomycetota bacterium]
MVEINPTLAIPRAELRFVCSRSPGPGGQNVNKVNTRVTLHFDVATSPLLTEAQRARILDKLSTRIDRSGVLRVVSSRHRTQIANRRAVVQRFAELLADALLRPKPRKQTRVSKGAIARRLETKAQRSAVKRLRGVRPSPDE